MVAAAPASAGSVSYSGSGFSIQDAYQGPSGVVPLGNGSTILVGDLGVITGVTISLNSLSHTYAGDLRATLSSPMGIATAVDLFDRLGVPQSTAGNDMDFGATYAFSDAAALSLPETSTMGPNAIIPGGVYRPEDALAAFNGQNAAGIWRLSLIDYAVRDTGSLGSWTLNIDFRDADAAVPEPTTWAMMIVGFGLTGFGLRRHRRNIPPALT